MKLDDLYKNSFYVKLIEDSQKLLKQEDRKVRIGKGFKKMMLGEKIPSRWDKLPAGEKFHLTTFRIITEIFYKLETLGHCIAYLNSYPSTSLWKKNFSRADYIKYHLESYYGNILGTFDRCLLLVNHLYDLGFEPRDAKYKLITKNKHLSGSKTLEILTRTHKALENIRSVRNYIEHQGSLSDKELDKISLYELLNKNKSLEPKLKKITKVLLKLGYSSYIRKKKKEVRNNNTAIILLANALFTSVEEKYNKGMIRLN